jgi:hypothetical protein
MTVTFTQEELEGFIGTEHYYRSSSFAKNIVHTDGVQHIVTRGGAWMVDVIVSHQTNPKVRAEEFQSWEFQVDGTDKGKAVCTDGNDHILIEQEIPFTDLPFNVKLWLELGSVDMVNPAWVIMLPGER